MEDDTVPLRALGGKRGQGGMEGWRDGGVVRDEGLVGSWGARREGGREGGSEGLPGTCGL